MKRNALLMAGMLLIFYVDAFLVGAPLQLLLIYVLIGGVVLAGFLEHADHGESKAIQHTTPLLSALAALVVMTLSRNWSVPVVVSAALVGSAGGLLEAWGRGRWPGLGAALYCGAFAGMTSELVLGHPAGVILSGALAGLVLELMHNSWSGIGGKLGCISFLGVLGSCGLATALGLIGFGAKPHHYSSSERILAMVVVLVAPQITHHLSYRWNLGAVLGSALPSLLAGLLLSPPLAGLWLGASFAGMTAPSRLVLHPRLELMAIGAFFGLFSLGFEPTLAGIGGDLGATAAVSVFAVLGLRRYYPRGLRKRPDSLNASTTAATPYDTNVIACPAVPVS